MTDKLEQDYENYLSIAEKMFSKHQLQGHSTGYSSLDTLVRGIKPGSLIVLAGATGIGKSLFALNVLTSLAKRGVSTSYYDLENGEITTKQRLVCIWANKTASFFEDISNLGDTLLTIATYSEHISYYDSIALGEENLYSKLLIHLESNLAEVILIDPLQSLESVTDSTSSFNEQGKIIKELKEYAQRTGKAVIVCHHLRKGQSTGKWVTDLEDVKEHKYQMPTIEDLKGSAKIADYATEVWGIVRTASADTREGRGKTLLRILKNRTGLKGDVRLFFDEDTLKFYETSKVYQEEEVINLFGKELV